MLERVRKYIEIQESRGYSEGLPDEAPIRLEQLNKAPSYKRICLAIIKNDHALKSLGGSPVKTKTYHAIKKDELSRRYAHKYGIQLCLFHSR